MNFQCGFIHLTVFCFCFVEAYLGVKWLLDLKMFTFNLKNLEFQFMVFTSPSTAAMAAYSLVNIT